LLRKKNRNERASLSVDALFLKNFIFRNPLRRISLQLDFSRKSKYFLKLDHAIDYTEVYKNMGKANGEIQLGVKTSGPFFNSGGAIAER
jgi:hypothetical protein